MTAQSITKPAAEPQATVAATGRSGRSARAGALPRAHRMRARFRGAGKRERRDYGVWLFVGLVFGVPESWAGIANPPWITLSDTVGHLEELWRPVKVMVAALMVFGVSMQSDSRRLTPASSPRGKASRSEREPRAAGSPRNAYESVEAFSETDFPEDLKFDVPTLVLHGEDDQIVPVKDSAVKSARLIKGAKEIYYPGAPHGNAHSPGSGQRGAAGLPRELATQRGFLGSSRPHARTHRSSGALVCRSCTPGHRLGLPRRDRPPGSRP